MYTYSFEKLEVWQLARQLVKDIYILTKDFPSEEKFSLTSQIRRSALSISANIAEGTSRGTSKDQAHFTQMAYSSLMELLNHLIVSTDLGYLTQNALDIIRPQIELLSNKLNAFHKFQKNRNTK
ncbi:MAG: four helix bundle protein [Cyclobacteriaceae bacterium]